MISATMYLYGDKVVFQRAQKGYGKLVFLNQSLSVPDAERFIEQCVIDKFEERYPLNGARNQYSVTIDPSKVLVTWFKMPKFQDFFGKEHVKKSKPVFKSSRKVVNSSLSIPSYSSVPTYREGGLTSVNSATNNRTCIVCGQKFVASDFVVQQKCLNCR